MRAADLIVTDANLITLDDQQPRAGAMAIYGGKIVYVGDDATAERFAGPATRRVNLNRKTVVPGFCDSHIHLFAFGQQLLTQADLVGTTTLDQILSRLSDLASQSSGWILGWASIRTSSRRGDFPRAPTWIASRKIGRSSFRESADTPPS